MKILNPILAILIIAFVVYALNIDPRHPPKIRSFFTWGK